MIIIIKSNLDQGLERLTKLLHVLLNLHAMVSQIIGTLSPGPYFPQQ